MPYIDDAYISAMISPQTRAALFTDGGVYDPVAASRALIVATSRVRGVLQGAGYTAPSDAEHAAMLTGADGQVADAENLRLAALGVWLTLGGMLRKQWALPTELRAALDLVTEIRAGELGFATLALKPEGAVGGSDFSDGDASSGDVAAPMFTKYMGR